MKALDILYRLFVRIRYPVSLPEEVAEALGIELPNHITISQLVALLTSSTCQPNRICKFMPRKQVEEAFQSARKKDIFKRETLFSYQFNDGWLEFILQFDDQSRLRRIYVQHRTIKEERGYEIPLKQMEFRWN